MMRRVALSILALTVLFNGAAAEAPPAVAPSVPRSITLQPVAVYDASGNIIPFAGMTVPTWAPVPDNTIDATNTYQVLCAVAHSGGTIQHQGPVGSGSLWVDVTGATGTTRSTAAMEVVARASAATGPGVYRFPPTKGAVTVYGPAGTTFQAFCG